MIKNRYIPISMSQLPEEYWLKHYTRIMGLINGFKVVKVYTAYGPKLFYELGKHIWRRT